MANVVLVGLEPSAAGQIGRALSKERHEIRNTARNVTFEELSEADIVFAGGDQNQYLGVLRHVRAAHPTLPVVVVTGLANTADWLDALEAGATDYCSAPFEARQINWIMESALHKTKPRVASAAA